MTKPETNIPKNDTAQQAQSQHQGAVPPKTEARAPWDLPLPFTLPSPEAFTHMMRDQIARTQGMMEELAVYEGVAVQRARTAVNDLSKLAADSIGYLAQISAEWRRMALDAGHRAADTFGPRS